MSCGYTCAHVQSLDRGVIAPPQASCFVISFLGRTCFLFILAQCVESLHHQTCVNILSSISHLWWALEFFYSLVPQTIKMEAHNIWASQMLWGQNPASLLLCFRMSLTLILGCLTSCKMDGTFNNTMANFPYSIRHLFEGELNM